MYIDPLGLKCSEIEFGIFPSIRNLITILSAIKRIVGISGALIEVGKKMHEALSPRSKIKCVIRKLQNLIYNFQLPIPVELLTMSEVRLGGSCVCEKDFKCFNNYSALKYDYSCLW